MKVGSLPDLKLKRYSVARSKSSARWLKEHFDDPFVKMAQKDGYRSRASYKLLEIQEKDRILRPGMTVIDLGSAPGGWSQVTSRVIGDKGTLIASGFIAGGALMGVVSAILRFAEVDMYMQPSPWTEPVAIIPYAAIIVYMGWSALRAKK